MDTAMLEKIRGLLAKAESTTFEAEAEALYAKAQELMVKYSIDEAILQAGGKKPMEEPTSHRILIVGTYPKERYLLLVAIARGHRARAVYAGEGKSKYATVVGFPSDLALVEMLYTSLLAHATAELVKIDPGSGITSTGKLNPAHARWERRCSWMAGFSSRISERFAEIARMAETQATSASSSGPSVALVLADRSQLVIQKFRQLFPPGSLGSLRRDAVKDHSTYAAGRSSADRADIGQPRVGSRKALPR